MIPYFCIYEAKYDQWLYDDASLRAHLSINMSLVPNEHVLTAAPGNPVQLDIEVISNTPIINEIGYYIEHTRIMKFEVLGDAENYLLYSNLPTDNGEFYSIRRIYC